MNFEEQAKVILKRKPNDKVDAFLKSCQIIRHSEELSKIIYTPLTDPKVASYCIALKHMQGLKKLELSKMPFIDPLALNAGIERVESFLELNKTLNTHGNPSNLSVDDIKKLMLLKKIFIDEFGKQAKYTPGTLLHQLGVVLVDKSISRKVEKLIDKAIDNIL
jgi:hypothetical protein